MYPVPVQHVYAQAVQCAQGGWMHECLGNGAMAGPLYHQAVQGLTACVQTTGAQTPDFVFYLLGSCQVRLAWMAYTAGNGGAAQGWLAQALPGLQAAWQRNPHNPVFQTALTQAALGLGRFDLAQQVSQQPAAQPQMTALVQMLHGTNPSAPHTQAGGAPDKVSDLIDKVGKGVDLFKKVMDLFGGSGQGGMPQGGGGFGGGWGFDGSTPGNAGYGW